MRTRAFVLAALISGCSMLNRNGPDVTCSDLQGGKQTACKDGIVASCPDGQSMVYKVCGDENACDADWQEPGAYRCAETDPLPGGDGGTGGTGGSGGGGQGGVGGAGTGGGQGCGPDDVCVVVSTGSANVDAYLIDGGSIYFSDCTTLWSVSKTGGFPALVTSALSGCALGSISVDGSHVYVNAAPTSVMRVAKTGGTPEVIATAGSDLLSMTADDSSVYWAESYLHPIKKVMTQGGAVVNVTTDGFSGNTRIVSDAMNLYWGDFNNLFRVAKSGGPQPSSAIPLGSSCATDLVIGGASIFVSCEGAGSIPGSITRFDLQGGQPITLATGLKSPGSIAVDSSNVYWVGNNNADIMRVPITGGTPTKVASTGNTPYESPGRILTDDDYVYWAMGPKLMRAPK